MPGARLHHAAPLPTDRPRYLMGVGKPIDHRRSGLSRHRHVRLRHSDPVGPPRPGLDRYGALQHQARRIRRRATRRSTRQSTARPRRTIPAYIHHLIRSKEMLGQMLLSWHNIAYFEHLMRRVRRRSRPVPSRISWCRFPSGVAMRPPKQGEIAVRNGLTGPKAVTS